MSSDNVQNWNNTFGAEQPYTVQGFPSIGNLSNAMPMNPFPLDTNRPNGSLEDIYRLNNWENYYLDLGIDDNQDMPGFLNIEPDIDYTRNTMTQPAMPALQFQHPELDGRAMNALSDIGPNSASASSMDLYRNVGGNDLQLPSSQSATVINVDPHDSTAHPAAKTAHSAPRHIARKIGKSKRMPPKQSNDARLKRLKGPYLDDELRRGTGQTRINHACIRCRNQKSRKYGQIFNFDIQEYPLTEHEQFLSPLTPEGNLLTKKPFHIPNTQEFVDSYKKCIIADAAKCANRLLTGSSTFTRKIFAKAFGLAEAQDGLKSKVVRSALHFWIAARSTESGWVISNPESLGMGPEHKGKLLEIPYVEHQLTWILMNDFLAPLCAEVLADIQQINKSGKAGDWLGQYLATFIVLHNYELLVKRQKAFTISRNWTKTPYTNMPLLNNIQLGAKTLLASYHYSTKNGARFSMNWHNDEEPRILGFNSNDRDFLSDLAMEATRLSQMFNSNWEPLKIARNDGLFLPYRRGASNWKTWSSHSTD
ncbi:hypothetical protein BKA61DRAFT_575453 [Leptodontidium sp. MPI-SDFR-AT-0119]|nr:hypothetical protein BKA61DRAFT_575453 [Leptodontidium sp. MPI-SDFR-AT-0119]